LLFIKTSAPEETAGVGEKLARFLRAGDVICLNGELGAGKTRFAQGVARGLGVAGHVTSPSFTLINEYSGRIPFYHMDFYRLENPGEIEDLGCEEYFYGNGVTLVEWAERAGQGLPGERLDVVIRTVPGEDSLREICVKPLGERYRGMVEELKAVVRTGD